jgi:hypothetical protein
MFELESKRRTLSDAIYDRRKKFIEWRIKLGKHNLSNLSIIWELPCSKQLSFLLKHNQYDHNIDKYLDDIFESGEIAINILSVHIQMLEVSKLMLKHEFFGSRYNLRIRFESSESSETSIFKSEYSGGLFSELQKNEIFGKSAQGLMALHAIFKLEDFFKPFLSDTKYIQWANQFYIFQRIMKPKELKMDKYFKEYNDIKAKFDKRLYFT